MRAAGRSSGVAGRRRVRRRGVVMIESALVYSVTFMLLLGTIVMGLGIFQYQQIASLAREGSRWAGVHGATWVSEQDGSAITQADVLNNAVLPHAIILDKTALTCKMSPSTLTSSTKVVTVTLSYTWTPQAYWAPITMTSTSTSPVLY